MCLLRLHKRISVNLKGGRGVGAKGWDDPSCLSPSKVTPNRGQARSGRGSLAPKRISLFARRFHFLFDLPKGSFFPFRNLRFRSATLGPRKRRLDGIGDGRYSWVLPAPTPVRERLGGFTHAHRKSQTASDGGLELFGLPTCFKINFFCLGKYIAAFYRGFNQLELELLFSSRFSDLQHFGLD